MRLTRCWTSIAAFKNASKSCLLPVPLRRDIFWYGMRQPSVTSKPFSCACERYETSHIFVSSMKKSRLMKDSLSSRQFSVSIPTVNATAAVNENETKPRSRTLDQVVYHLQADIRRRRRIHKADIHNAIELVEKASRVENFGPFLLNCCCDILPDLHQTYRIKLAERIWTVIQIGKEHSAVHFESMLKILAINEDKTFDPFKFLDEAKSAGVNATGTMYYFALLIVCQRGDLDSAVKLLNAMKENNVSVNERFFNALMLGNLRSGDVNGATTDILKIMRASKIDPSIHTWNTLLHVYVELGNAEKLRQIYVENVGSRLSEDQFYELLKAAGRQDEKPEIMDLIIGWALESQKVHALSVMSLSLQLMYLGYPQSALKIIVEFRDVLRTRKELLGTFLIKELLSANIVDPDAYLKLVKSLHGESRNPYALNLAAEACLKQRNFDLALRVFESMMSLNAPVRPHYFLPAFVAETTENGSLGGIKVLKQMSALKLQPDWEMLLNWVIPILFHTEENLYESLRIIKEATGLSYSSGGLVSAAIIVAIQEGKLQQGLNLIESVSGKLSHPENIMQALLLHICDMQEDKDIPSITKFIKYVTDNKPSHNKKDLVGAFIVKLLEADRSEEAEMLLKDILELRIPVSETAAEILGEKMNFKEELEIGTELNFQSFYNGSANQISSVSEMDLTSLECHKQELESKNMNARGIDRKLFLKYCVTEQLEKVLEAKKTFEAEFGAISRGMKSALMGAYIRNEVLKPAMELFQELTNVTENVSDVVVDVYKIIDLATLMVKNGLLEEAVLLIHEKCPTRRVHRPEHISRNIVNLLEAVSKSSLNSDYVHDLTHLFLKLRFIKPINPTLAPSIRDLIRKDDLEGAVSRFEEYTKKYAVSPCLQELTYAVLQKPELLDRLVKSSASIKGEREAQRLLAIAKADMGDIDGAAKGFMELGNNLSFASIMKQCEYLSSKQEVGKILNLIKALHKTGQKYDCRKLYEIAVQGCTRSGNIDGLRQVLSCMEEQDLYISPTLKELLVKSI